MRKEIQKLVTLYLTQEGTISNLDDLSEWIQEPENKKEFIEYVKINYAIDCNMKDFGMEDSKKKLLTYIENDIRVSRRKKVIRFVKYAAVLLIFIGIALVYQMGYFGGSDVQKEKFNEDPLVSKEPLIPAGSNKAVLTTEDGSYIYLEKGEEIKTASFKSNGEDLIYENSKNSTSKVAYNFLTIPRGGQFNITLADGTKVWLNSESQLKYPIAFIPGKVRKVELVYGEAYFDVSPSTNHQGSSFKVVNQSQEIEVLGTEFNLKAYKQEMNIYTTLIEGKVVVSSGKSKKTLTPGQQSNLNSNNNDISIEKVDVNNEILWIKGIFSFKNMRLNDIAKVISRWYNVDVVFEKPELEELEFNGIFRKDQPLEDILESIVLTKTINAYEVKNGKILIQ